MSKAQAKQAMTLHQRRGISLKSAWAIVKGGRSTTKKGKGKGRSSRGYVAKARGFFGKHAGKIGLTSSVIIAGAVQTVTKWGETQKQEMYRSIEGALGEIGVKMKVTGATIMAALLVLNVAAAISPWVGVKLNAILGRAGVKL